MRGDTFPRDIPLDGISQVSEELLKSLSFWGPCLHPGEVELSHPPAKWSGCLQTQLSDAKVMHPGASVARQPFRLRGASFAASPGFSRLSRSPRVSRDCCRFSNPTNRAAVHKGEDCTLYRSEEAACQ